MGANCNDLCRVISIKDFYIVLIIIASGVFLYLRLIKREKRMTQSGEAVLILCIIIVMMFADVLYDGGLRVAGGHAAFSIWEPLGSIVFIMIQSFSDTAIQVLTHVGFWCHVGLVLIFLNLLPYSKHFHVVTSLPNVFLSDLSPRGRVTPIEDIEGKLEREETLGIRRINQFSWKSILDWYTCTECGRCTDQCPAANTGKLLSPKLLTVGLRDFLYAHSNELTNKTNDHTAEDEIGANIDLIGDVIEPEVLWACTTCGACEEECPLSIRYIDTIVDLRRYMVQEKGEFPETWQETFQSLEVTGSPYGVGEEERLNWAKGLDVPLRCETDSIDILLWIGCAPATDERAKGIARAMAELLNIAGIKWAVLGSEERCTGDVARRAGNEYLFQMIAEMNIEILDGYDTTKIVTICPHCMNTLKHEYPDFGGNYEVISHVEYLEQLVSEGKLKPRNQVSGKVVYHDSCYLGRFNDIYDGPRKLLRTIPGLELIEANESRDRGMCCGAGGGGQMFKEDEPGDERISNVRVKQLCATGAQTIATACPFCMRMMTDALNLKQPSDDYIQKDIAELLLASI